MVVSSRAAFCGLLLAFSLLATSCAEVEYVSHWAKTWSDDEATPSKRIDIIHGDPIGNPQPATDRNGSYYKVGSAYNIGGAWYRPQESFTYDQTGIASWYGPNFHGKKTANGEIYDKYALTAAHPTLQMPSLVRVTNLENGRSVVVRINDRGPFARGRIIDLSKRAAELLDMINQGTARVRVQVLPEESRKLAAAAKRGVPLRQAMLDLQGGYVRQPSAPQTKPETRTVLASGQTDGDAYYLPEGQRSRPVLNAGSVSPTSYNMSSQGLYTVQTTATEATDIYVQIGAFRQRENAELLRAKVTHLQSPVSVHEAVIDGQLFFRVRLGPAATVQQADTLLSDALRAGYNDARIVVEERS